MVIDPPDTIYLVQEENILFNESSFLFILLILLILFLISLFFNSLLLSISLLDNSFSSIFDSDNDVSKSSEFLKLPTGDN